MASPRRDFESKLCDWPVFVRTLLEIYNINHSKSLQGVLLVGTTSAYDKFVCVLVYPPSPLFVSYASIYGLYM